MAECIVINTGPLITLVRMEALEVPGHFAYEFICPQEIRGELEAGAVAGQPVVNPSWLHVCPLHWTLSRLALLGGLDAGEAAVILLALKQRIPLVCIDEWESLVFIGINDLCGWAVGINGLKTTRFSVLGKRIRRCAYSCTPHNLTLSLCRV